MAFDQGQKPRIAVVNQATVALGVELNALIAALNSFVNGPFAAVWGTPANIVIASIIAQGEWGLVLLDDADAANALGYHDVNSDGMPLAKVFVKDTPDNGGLVSVTAAHEVFEYLVDPGCNLCASHPDGTIYAYECADACEEVGFEHEGVMLSDFVYPSWFEGFRAKGSSRFNHLESIAEPFQLLEGGYAIISQQGRWSEIFGSRGKAARFAKEDRRGHRSELRKSSFYHAS